MSAKGKRKGSSRPKVSYKVVQQSYEDKDYQSNPKPVLVPTAMLERKRRKPMLEFGDDLPEDFTDKRNMKMTDDLDKEEEDRIFGDEVEAEFDQDFIRQMMTGEGLDDEEAEEEEDEGDADGAKHDKSEFGANERMFAAMLREFELDRDIEEDDPRTHGPLGIETYAEALEQFAEDNAGTTWMDEGEPTRHKGLIQQLKTMSREHNVFDSNAKGLFYAVAADKGARIARQFKQEQAALLQLTKAQLKAGLIDTEDVLYKDEKDIAAADGVQVVEVKEKHDRMDCETVLSTYSTLYNHPNVIAAERGRLRVKRQRQSKEDLAAANANANEEDDAPSGATDRPCFEAIRYELSMPPENESAEEKKARRKLVKQLQAERRQQKKMVKGAYTELFNNETVSRNTSKAAKAITPFSLVPAVVKR